MAARYEDILSIDAFSGLNQSGDNLRMSFAADGYNFNIKHGKLCSTGTVEFAATESGEELPFPTIDPETATSKDLASTFGIISQRWKDGYSGAIPAYTKWAITVSDGKIYARKSVKGLSDGFWGTDWEEIYDGGFQNDLFDHVTYELNYAPPELFTTELLIKVMNKTISLYAFDVNDYAYHILKGGDGYAYYTNNDNEEKRIETDATYVRKGYEYPVDALVMSNSKDGMYLVYCPPQGAGNEPVLKVTPIRVQPSGETHEMKFGCIARYAERIWGAGIETDPDKLVYSAPYDIFNWEQNNEMPEDGAGDIQQPDWDGDGFTALKAFGNQLVCFKKQSVWAITGTNPSAFYMRKQYGHGTIYEDSIAVYGGNMFFFTDTGMHTYDGITTSPLKYGYIDQKLEYFNSIVVRNAIGTASNGKYYLVFSGAGMIVFDTIEGTISLKNVYPRVMIAQDDDVYMLAHENGWLKLGKVSDKGAEAFYYQTAWQDFGAKNVIKSEYEVYLSASIPMGDYVDMTVGIETERGKKEKTVRLEHGKFKRVRLNAKGRRMRFSMKTEKQNMPWYLNGGIQISYSLDYD